MADKKPKKSFEETLQDVGGAIMAAVTTFIALSDDNIRPHIINVWDWIRLAGLDAWDIIRDVYARHLVSVILRPWLTVVSVIVTLVMIGQSYVLWRLGLPLWTEGLTYLLVFGFAAVIGMWVQRIRIHRVRGVDTSLAAWASLPQGNRTQANADRIFGRPGLAPSTVIAILFGQSAVALQVGGLAMLMREMPFSHERDPRMSIVVMLLAVIGFVVIGVQYIVMARVVGWTIVTGAGIATTVVRAVLRPILIPFPTIDVDNVDEFLPEGLGFPRHEVGLAVSTGHEYLFGVSMGWLACLIPEHNFWCVIGLTTYAVVFLGVYKMLKTLTHIVAKWIYDAIVITFVVFAPLALTRRLQMTSVWSDLRTLGDAWVTLSHTEASVLVVVGAGAVALGYLAYKKIPHKQVSYPVLYLGLLIGLLSLGLCATRMIELNQIPSEETATSASTRPAPPDDPRPPRSDG